MSISATKILLATDVSEEAELAARTAIDLAGKTGSELHVVYVLVLPPRPCTTPSAPPRARSSKRGGERGSTSWWEGSRPPGERSEGPTSGSAAPPRR